MAKEQRVPLVLSNKTLRSLAPWVKASLVQSLILYPTHPQADCLHTGPCRCLRGEVLCPTIESMETPEEADPIMSRLN